MTGEAASDIKEVQMDVAEEGAVQTGGGTRRRRRARRTKTQKGGADIGEQSGGSQVTVEKSHNVATAPVISSPAAPAPAAAPVPPPAPKQSGGAKPTVAKQLATKPAPIVVLAPAKKKAKIMLISKKGVPTTPSAPAKLVPPKTFKAKRVRVTIDNTARTQKRRRQVLRSVDSLTEEQLKEQAVKFGLSRADSVKKVPVDLLRKMLKDYYAMRKGFI